MTIMNIFFFVFLIGGVFCQQNEIPENVQKSIESKLSEIPELANFNQSALPDLAEVENAIKKKCESNGGSEAYEKLGPAKEAMMECIQNNFNFTEIEEEIDQARQVGAMEEVFAKYCAKKQIVLDCLNNLTGTIEPCLEVKEKMSLKVFKNVTSKMAEFFCYKDGDRVAMFIAEGGFECIESQKESLQKCANDTLGHRIPSDISVTNLPLFVIDEEGCQDYLNLQECVVEVLERCKDSTPANIIDALFKFVRQITPCKNIKSKSKPATSQRKYKSPNSSNSNIASFLLLSLIGFIYYI